MTGERVNLTNSEADKDKKSIEQKSKKKVYWVIFQG